MERYCIGIKIRPFPLYNRMADVKERDTSGTRTLKHGPVGEM